MMIDKSVQFIASDIENGIFSFKLSLRVKVNVLEYILKEKAITYRVMRGIQYWAKYQLRFSPERRSIVFFFLHNLTLDL